MITTEQAGPEVVASAPIVPGRKDYLTVLFRLVGMDLYKVQRRMLSRMLLLVGMLIIGAIFFLLGIVAWNTASKPVTSFVPPVCMQGRKFDFCVKNTPALADMQAYKTFLVNKFAADLNMPGTWGFQATFIFSLLMVLGIILAGALVGGEYSVGTVRLMFSRGPTRLQFLFAKIMVLAIYIVPAVLILMLTATLVGAIMAPLTGVTATFGFLTAGFVGHFALYFLEGTLYWFAFAMMALFFGTIGRSTVAGIVGPLIWLSVEPILTRLIVNLVGDASGGWYDFVKAIPDYFLSNSLGSLINNQQAALFGGSGGAYTDVHSLLVVVGYLVAFVSLAIWATKKRDVTH
jgi:ABC-type transport system involved in multi-copper enzyme maturation permease subunit